jgi:hypothetical protein
MADRRRYLFSLPPTAALMTWTIDADNVTEENFFSPTFPITALDRFSCAITITILISEKRRRGNNEAEPGENIVYGK